LLVSVAEPPYGDGVYKQRARMGSLFKTDIANKAIDAMRAGTLCFVLNCVLMQERSFVRAEGLQ